MFRAPRPVNHDVERFPFQKCFKFRFPLWNETRGNKNEVGKVGYLCAFAKIGIDFCEGSSVKHVREIEIN